MGHQGQVPQDLNDVTIVHLYKNKWNSQLSNKHQGITLLNIVVKIFAHILLNRLNAYLEQGLLAESQCGFRRHGGTIEVIFAARQLQEKCQEMRTHLYTTFVDLTKAFDTQRCPGRCLAIQGDETSVSPLLQVSEVEKKYSVSQSRRKTSKSGFWLVISMTVPKRKKTFNIRQSLRVHPNGYLIDILRPHGRSELPSEYRCRTFSDTPTIDDHAVKATCNAIASSSLSPPPPPPPQPPPPPPPTKSVHFPALKRRGQMHFRAAEYVRDCSMDFIEKYCPK
ncbi:unnamed protein product [Schistocephalus solidus]|uniref:Reverse transcriptase domain-containing protein n=1 Tax=Schistocephalus solidus TaxID=70667 RepID=A0A183TLU7_SCHSO|nr:unnamed protein product [Schistocephalus solidus]